MTIVAYVPNIFDRSRFDGKHRNRINFVDDAAELAKFAPDLIIVDLDRCTDPASFTASGRILGNEPCDEDRIRSARTIGFGSHVEAEALAEAAKLGFDEVLPRSRFFRQLPDILADLTSQPQPPTGSLPSDES